MTAFRACDLVAYPCDRLAIDIGAGIALYYRASMVGPVADDDEWSHRSS
jgi:hypothetical protein